MAKVDVVIPNYQYGRYLEQCVESVLTQSIADVRVLIIDNASTDDSVEIAQRLVTSDRRVELITHPRNVGHVSSINEGIDWAQSEYFMVLCSDDALAGGALERAVTIMDVNTEIVSCNGNCVNFSDDEAVNFLQDTSDGWPWRVYSGDQYIRTRCLSPMLSKANFLVTRTRLQKQAGHYSLSLPHTNDLHMILRLCQFGQFAETESVQGFRREHGQNFSSECWDDRLARLNVNLAAFGAFLANEGQSLPDASSLRASVGGALASQAYWSGVANLISGRPRAAGALLRFAVSQSPRCAIIPPISALLSKKVFSRIRLAMSEAVAGRSARVGPSIQARP